VWSALTLCTAAGAASITPHGDRLLLLRDVSEVGQGALKLPSVDGLGGLAGVLEGDTQIAAAGASRLAVVYRISGVADLRTFISLRTHERAALDSKKSGQRGAVNSLERGGRRRTILTVWRWAVLDWGSVGLSVNFENGCEIKIGVVEDGETRLRR
jgi:hypothetical protein